MYDERVSVPAPATVYHHHMAHIGMNHRSHSTHNKYTISISLKRTNDELKKKRKIYISTPLAPHCATIDISSIVSTCAQHIQTKHTRRHIVTLATHNIFFSQYFESILYDRIALFVVRI